MTTTKHSAGGAPGDRHRSALAGMPPDQWDTYLRTCSGLPGPRANLELAQTAADLGEERAFRRWLASDDEFLALCGAIGIGRLIADGRGHLWPLLRAAADDPRWRVREAVAMGLQRVGDASTEELLEEIEVWVDGSPLLRRAAVAGIAEPRLLGDRATVRQALMLVERITRTLLHEPDRRDPRVQTLRQALGYCWSVVVSADPDHGLPAFMRLEATDDPDARWITRENRRKKRLQAAMTKAASEPSAAIGRKVTAAPGRPPDSRGSRRP
ncbi:HEAT repeat domain-containing protein [Dactylosporangium sp. NBC_01737]|uniref:HEAT repeat domain-containing protein n=1 Tax=Dactylosporangium sp. NBC_01737 TaxID=2975959 RepID=UPI002E0D429E|nr:HEAT repeat domain-containing protein [Dactylosporangium sp. NBC_01737]